MRPAPALVEPKSFRPTVSAWLRIVEAAMSDKGAKMGDFLKEVSNWTWDEFWHAERDDTYTSNEAIIFALIRACTMQKMDAIKISLNRLDGKLKTPVKVEYPRIFFVYPNATAIGPGEELPKLQGEVLEGEIVGTELIVEPEPELPSLSMRQTLTKMSDFPRKVPAAIVKQAQLIEEALREGKPVPVEVPLVKSVVAAHLLVLAQQRNINALYEVFDQIDGKLAETIQILGEDIYVTSYLPEAPAGAEPNADGILMIEAKQTSDLWAHKLGREMEHGR
jgi:hypothetical protein